VEFNAHEMKVESFHNY